MLKKLWAILVVAIGLFVFAGNALASTTHHSRSQAISLYRPFPEGIDPNNAQRALSEVMARASWDTQYAGTIAQQTGATSFDPSQYVTLGYKPHAPAGTTNSALTGSGTIVPLADHGGSQNVKVLVVMNISTKRTVSLMVRCGNPRLHPFVPVIPFKPFSKGTVIVVNRSVSKPVSITCPSGQTVSGSITATVKGTVRAKTWGKVQGNLNLQLQEQVNLQVKAFVSLKCGPAPTPPALTPPAPQPPAQVFSATATATATASAVCPDGTTATASGSGFGSATSTVSQQDAQNKANAIANAQATANANASVKCGSAPPPPPPPAAPSVTITSMTTLNDIPTGKTSGPFTITVTASAPGSFTLDPGVGGVSDCSSSTPQGSFSSTLSTGNNSICVILYAPSDSGVTSMTITATAIVTTSGGTAKDVKPQTFTISYPVRPV